MYKRTSAKFVTAFIELEERYRKQTKECHLQNSFSEINHTMCWWRCRTQLSTGAKLPQQRSEFFSLRFKNIGCRITSPELGPRCMTKHIDPFFHLKFVSPYKYLVNPEIHSTFSAPLPDQSAKPGASLGCFYPNLGSFSPPRCYLTPTFNRLQAINLQATTYKFFCTYKKLLN